MRTLPLLTAIAFAAIASGGGAHAEQFLNFSRPSFWQPPSRDEMTPYEEDDDDEDALPQMAPPRTVTPPSAAPRSAVPEQAQPTENNDAAQLAPRLRRQVVAYTGREPAGTIIVDTPHTYLYYVLGDGKALRYGIGVGREGFTWSGVRSIERKAEWPDWYPPPEMIARQPYLPRMVAGGPSNPLGARALYIAGTQYRIHGTNEPSSIGKFVSSGCIRLINDDAIDLYNRVQIGAKVVVLPQAATARQEKDEIGAPPAPARNAGARPPAPDDGGVPAVASTRMIRPGGLY